MKIRTKIFIAFLLLFIFGIGELTYKFKDRVRRSYLESLEANMVDTANILAIIAERCYGENGQFNQKLFTETFERVGKRRPNANIYGKKPQTIDSGIYITDTNGIVLYDSTTPVAGIKYDWRDVNLTLKGKYGARTTRLKPDDPSSATMFVAAPIKNKNGQTIGSLSYIKPVKFISLFIKDRITILLIQAAIITVAGVLIVFLLSLWIAQPIGQLTDYVKRLKNGERTDRPDIGKGELGELGDEFEKMRDALEGRKYVEHYVQGLTHELKSPISAIKGAVELIDDPGIADEARHKFICNISRENQRMQQIVDQLLHLSRLESRKTEETRERLSLNTLLTESFQDWNEKALPGKKFMIALPSHELPLRGDRFLIREAIDNLIRNSVDFTGPDGLISIHLESNTNHAVITINDNGTGIPDYARDRIFERFYSLSRPGGSKSSGLGLSIVSEIVKLHNGTVAIENNPSGGSIAKIVLPLSHCEKKSLDR